MKTRNAERKTYEAFNFNSWQEAIDWIESTLQIKEHYKLSKGVSAVPPALIRITLNEYYENGDEKEEPNFKMRLYFEMDANNTLIDFIELHTSLFKWFESIKGFYYDYLLDSYRIIFRGPSNKDIELFNYELQEEE